MPRVVKVFGTPSERKAVADQHRALADYKAFTVVEVSDGAVAQLARKHLIEDITDQYVLPTDEGGVESTPGVPRRAAASRGLPPAAAPKSPGPGRHHYVVQFVGPIKAAWLTRIRKEGGEPRAPYQGFAYVVRADIRQAKEIAALPFVRGVAHLAHRARVSAATQRRIAGGAKAAATIDNVPRTRVRDGVYTVQFFGPEDAAKAVAKVRKLGFKILDRPEDDRLLIVGTDKPDAAQAGQVEKLSAVHGVQQIRERSIKRPSNDVSAGLMGAAPAGTGLGLSGQGETVCVCDTGLDTGDPQTIHPDFAGRITAIKSFPITPDFSSFIKNPGANDGPSDRDSGHGTHVAGSVLGDGASSAGLPGLVAPIRGLAHKASLVFQAIEQELDWKNPADEKKFGRFLLAGIPADLRVLLQHAYSNGARIHSNSWGGGDPGAYDTQCHQLDEFVWKHKDMCVLVAAGNDGTDQDGDGAINPMSVTSPGTAKNCITIGASENKRPGFNHDTYGGWWPTDYPRAPFKNDPMANDPDQVVAFSSRGPTADGRFKPDVLAPGTFVLSTRSTRIAANNKGWAAYPPSRLYFHMGGTSMATPLAAGAVALLREHVTKKKIAGGATAALLKALLVASATRLPAAGARRVVDNDQGFGRIDLRSVVTPTNQRKAVLLNVTPGLKTGDLWTKSVKVSGTVSLRVVLAYSDFPGQALVNNLNLMVHAPDGTRYVGNQAQSGAAALDSSNNVEVVDIPKTSTGQWRIEVVGSNVAHGPQDFALVIVGRVS